MRSHSRVGFGLWFLAIAGLPALVRGQTPSPPSLGAAASFAVLGGSEVTSSGSTMVTGNLGVSPGNTVTGFPPGTVKVGATFRNDSTARQAQRDAAAAYDDLAGRACGSDLSGQDLGGRTLGPGIYCFSSSAQLTGTLILDAANDPGAVWVFRVGSTLTAAPDSAISFVNAGHESNVFWQVGAAAILGTRTVFLGNVLALGSITLNGGASVSGRLLARTGAVALDNNSVSLCCDLTLPPQTLPNGLTGTPYGQTTIMASGGTGLYAFSVGSGALPDGLNLNSPAAGVISGTPTKKGTFAFRLTAADSHDCMAAQDYTITIAPSCQTITVTNPSTTSGKVSSLFNQTFEQAGAIGTSTFSTISTLPPNLTLDAATGVLQGTPMQAGSFPIVVTVTDSNGCTANGPTYNLTICQTITVTANNPLTPNGAVSVPFSQQFEQTGAIGGATFTTTSPLPAGLVLSSGGLLSGTPTQTGSFPVVVTVTDGNLCAGTAAPYPLVICQIITVANPPTKTGAVSSPFNQLFTQAGGIGATTFTTVSTLPAGLTLSSGGLLSGTPTQTGSFPIVVTATDSNGCIGSGPSYLLVITNPPGCVLTPATLPSPVLGTPFNETITASGGTAPYTFSISGTLPPGLTFMQTTPTTATISGTPTTNGVFTFCITVTDANLCTVTQCYTMIVAAGGPALSLWGMLVLSAFLAAAGWVAIQRCG